MDFITYLIKDKIKRYLYYIVIELKCYNFSIEINDPVVENANLKTKNKELQEETENLRRETRELREEVKDLKEEIKDLRTELNGFRDQYESATGK